MTEGTRKNLEKTRDWLMKFIQTSKGTHQEEYDYLLLAIHLALSRDDDDELKMFVAAAFSGLVHRQWVDNVSFTTLAELSIEAGGDMQRAWRARER